MSSTFRSQISSRISQDRCLTYFLWRSLSTDSHHVNAGNRSSQNTISKILADKLTLTAKHFDGVLGISEVRAAQIIVEEAENRFMKSRRSVQQSRVELVQLQSQLRELRTKLDRIPREDERYLQLATEEHKVLIEERKLKADLEGFVALERDNFEAFSAAIRNAHEKERSRAERTKYWSIIGSACGAVLGILGSTIINMKRMNQIKLTVQENNQSFMSKTMEEIKMIINPGELEATSADDSAETSYHDDISSPTKQSSLHPQLTENNKILRKVVAEFERFSKDDFDSVKNLGTEIQELKKELSRFGLLEARCSPADSVNVPAFLEFNRKLNDISWWSKASIAASVTGICCSLLLCIFYR